jgi:hypothetical protein
MPSLYAEIEINASRATVWQALVRKQEWFYWNTFLYDLESDRPFTRGQEVLLSLRRLEGEGETEIKPRITVLQPEICLGWSYSAPGYRSEHIFELQEVGRNRTKYLHRERISGALSRMFLFFIRQDEQQGLQRMARQLKRYVEEKSVRDRQL